jgi:hypothetical protein
MKGVPSTPARLRADRPHLLLFFYSTPAILCSILPKGCPPRAIANWLTIFRPPEVSKPDFRQSSGIQNVKQETKSWLNKVRSRYLAPVGFLVAFCLTLRIIFYFRGLQPAAG